MGVLRFIWKDVLLLQVNGLFFSYMWMSDLQLHVKRCFIHIWMDEWMGELVWGKWMPRDLPAAKCSKFPVNDAIMKNLVPSVVVQIWNIIILNCCVFLIQVFLNCSFRFGHLSWKSAFSCFLFIITMGEIWNMVAVGFIHIFIYDEMVCLKLYMDDFTLSVKIFKCVWLPVFI